MKQNERWKDKQNFQHSGGNQPSLAEYKGPRSEPKATYVCCRQLSKSPEFLPAQLDKIHPDPDIELHL